MPSDESKQHTITIDYVEDIIGADTENDRLRIDIAGQSESPLLIEVPTGEVLETNLEQIGGQAQSAVDVADKIDQIEDALNSVGTDELVVRPTDSTGTQIDLATDALEGALQTNDSDEFISRITDSSGTQIDPLSDSDASPKTDSTTSAATDISLDLGSFTKQTDVHVDTSGAATLTVEISTDNATWYQLDSIDYQSATTVVEQYTTGFRYIRASVDSNLNNLVMSAKGI